MRDIFIFRVTKINEFMIAGGKFLSRIKADFFLEINLFTFFDKVNNETDALLSKFGFRNVGFPQLNRHNYIS